MSKRLTIAALDDRLMDVERMQDATNEKIELLGDKIDNLTAMFVKHDAAKSAQLSRKAKLVSSAIGTAIGAAITGLVTGCFW